MRCLGRVILSLGTRIWIFQNSDVDTLRQCEMFIAQNYTAELHNLTVSLLMQNYFEQEKEAKCKGRHFQEMAAYRGYCHGEFREGQ